jgi:Flp pilus assembly protein TadD
VGAPTPKIRRDPPVPPSSSEPAACRLDRARALLITALVACATLPYLNILVNGFVYDDDVQVKRNPYIRSFHYLKEIFTSNAWSYLGGHGSNYYRPMMTLGYLLCYKLFGLKAYGFHLDSLLLHVLVVCLVFVLTERLTGNRVTAFVAGAFFALHPVHTESVAWIAAVTDLELTFFYLLTFGLFLALARPGARCSRLMLAAMGVTFALALLSKEPAMTLPALATAYEHFWRDDRSETSTFQKIVRYGVLWLVAAAYVPLRIHFLASFAPAKNVAEAGPWQIVLSAMALVGQYVGKLLSPVRLCAFYVFHPSTSPLDLPVLAGLLVFLMLAALFLVCWRSPDRNVRFASFAILWFLATLAPALNAHWVAANVFTERYLYLPSVGVAWLAGLGATKLWTHVADRPAQRLALLLAGVVVAGLFAARIVTRNRDWNNDLVLYAKTVELSPDADYIQNLLAAAYYNAGKQEDAERIWRRLLARNPNDPHVLNHLGQVHLGKQDYPQACKFFKKAVEVDPGNAEAHFNLGLAYMGMRSAGPAEAELRTAVSLTPSETTARNALGKLYLAEGRLAEAEEQFRRSVEITPSVLGYTSLGTIDWERGDAKSAEQEWREALKLAPNDSWLLISLGLACMSQGRYTEAVAYFRQAAGLKPNDPLPHLNLGIAYGKLGQNGSAEAEYLTALSLDPANSQAHLQLGDLYVSLGRREEALKEFQVALKNNPADREAFAAVEKLRAQVGNR